MSFSIAYSSHYILFIKRLRWRWRCSEREREIRIKTENTFVCKVNVFWWFKRWESREKKRTYSAASKHRLNCCFYRWLILLLILLPIAIVYAIGQANKLAMKAIAAAWVWMCVRCTRTYVLMRLDDELAIVLTKKGKQLEKKIHTNETIESVVSFFFISYIRQQ